MQYVCRRFSSQFVKKRFYKNADIVSSGDGAFEICLDGKKIKTPNGNFVKIKSKMLALAVANEWDSQKDTIKLHSMHLTGLSVTSIDNPLKHTTQTLVAEIMKYLDSDTLLYIHEENEKLRQLQHQKWGDVINWIKKFYDIDLHPTSTFDPPNVPDEAKRKLRSHLASYNFWCLIGYQYAVESLKSLILTFATVHGRLNVDDAVKLGLLEQEFQISDWGRVEWAHDVDYHEHCCRLAAGVFFVNACRQTISEFKNDSVSI